MPGREVVVIGAGGAQAQAMLTAAERAGAIAGWAGVDRAWSERSRRACAGRGMETIELDVLAEPDRLCEAIAGASLVANFAGPYYRTGGAVLDACIEVGCDYLDICDDADATLDLLGRTIDASAAGVRALIGMGSSPGVTNVLVRAGADALGGADEACLSWIVDVDDVDDAALQHFWHIFAPVDGDGTRHPVPSWEELTLRTAPFPDPLGEQTVVGLSHPEPITIPRFLGIESVRSFGSIAPADVLVVNWALARLGAGGGEDLELGPERLPIQSLASELYRSFRQTRKPSEYLGGGLVVDVWSGAEGIRFAAADKKASMGESTGVPAAAGILLMLEGGPGESGVIAPECLDPSEFFAALGRCSRGSGSLGAYRLRGSEQGERIRIRDLLQIRVP